MDRFRVSWFGIGLVVIGAVLLLNRLHLFYLPFSSVFWALVGLGGLFLSIRGFSGNRNGKVFWGTVLFLFGVFFLLRHSDYVEMYPFMFVPSTFLIVGIAFFMMFVNNTREWYLLIPALILAGIGGLFIATEYGYLYRWEVADAVRMYWPLALILFGLAVMFRYRAGHPRKNDVLPPPEQETTAPSSTIAP